MVRSRRSLRLASPDSTESSRATRRRAQRPNLSGLDIDEDDDEEYNEEEVQVSRRKRRKVTDDEDDDDLLADDENIQDDAEMDVEGEGEEEE